MLCLLPNWLQIPVLFKLWLPRYRSKCSRPFTLQGSSKIFLIEMKVFGFTTCLNNFSRCTCPTFVTCNWFRWMNRPSRANRWWATLIFYTVIKFYETKKLITWSWTEIGQNWVWPYTVAESHCEILEILDLISRMNWQISRLYMAI